MSVVLYPFPVINQWILAVLKHTLAKSIFILLSIINTVIKASKKERQVSKLANQILVYFLTSDSL